MAGLQCGAAIAELWSCTPAPDQGDREPEGIDCGFALLSRSRVLATPRLNSTSVPWLDWPAPARPPS